MAQRYRGLIDALDHPGSLAAVTPHDDNDLDPIADELWVGGAGNVVLIGADDTVSVTITAVAAGTRLPWRVKRVLATNTTATLIIALS